MAWQRLERPGFFGRRRDEKVLAYNIKYGDGNWRLVWIVEPTVEKPFELTLEFNDACVVFYEQSYIHYMKDHPDIVDQLCMYRECFDNAETNVQSGLFYSRQEAFSTHIQDIAVRNALRVLNRRFTGKINGLLQIRMGYSNNPELSASLSPGTVPFLSPHMISQPCKKPTWAKKDSVEDFWQSNKWVQIKCD